MNLNDKIDKKTVIDAGLAEFALIEEDVDLDANERAVVRGYIRSVMVRCGVYPEFVDQWEREAE